MLEIEIQLNQYPSTDVKKVIEEKLSSSCESYQFSIEQHGSFFVARCFILSSSESQQGLMETFRSMPQVTDIQLGGNMRNQIQGPWSSHPIADQTQSLTPWQKQALQILQQPVTNQSVRPTIHWFHDTTGQASMSVFVKHLRTQYGFPRVVCESPKGIKTTVARHIHHSGFVMDMLHARGKKDGFCDTIEQIKIGHFFADEEVILSRQPNVVVFAYFEPEMPEPTQCDWVIRDVHDMDDTSDTETRKRARHE